MKKITSFFSAGSPVKKKIRSSTEETEEMEITTSDVPSADDYTNDDWPSCWTLEQKTDFCAKNEWLCFQEKKLGCTTCRKVGTLGVEATMGMKISKEWTNNEISYYGEDRKQQLRSLRKKIFDHKLHKESDEFRHLFFTKKALDFLLLTMLL